MRYCVVAVVVASIALVGCQKPKPTDVDADSLPHLSEGFIDATKYHYRHGAIEVRVLGAELSGPKSQAIQTPNDVRYVVRLQIRNVSDRAKLDYSPFGVWDGANTASLRDSFGNDYKLMSGSVLLKFGSRRDKESLYPGNLVEDYLAFECPVPEATELKLTVPGAAFGLEGAIKFRMPATGFDGKKFDATYDADITRMEYRQNEELRHEKRVLQEKNRQSEQAQVKLELERKLAEEAVAKAKKLNQERERAEQAKLEEARLRVEQQNTEQQYKLAQEKRQANERLRQAEAQREAEKKIALEQAKAKAALRVIRVPGSTVVPIGTSKFAVGEARRSADFQQQLMKSNDIIILTKDVEVSMVKAGVDYSEVTYKTKKYYVESKYLVDKTD